MYLKIGMDILVDSLYDTLTLVPYLYLTYLFMEYIEQHISRKSMVVIYKAKQYGSVVGGLLGLIPQCGFSVAAANLYATGLITLGALMAVFLSTSDEMLPILISGGIGGSLIAQILCLKVIYAIIAGVLIDKFLPENFIKHKNEPDIKAFCQQEKCKCDDKENIWYASFKHTEKIALFIFFFSIIINTIFFIGGQQTIQEALIGLPLLSKFIAALAGLIPSCYPSVFLTQLYISHTITLGTMMAGTLANAGLGYLVLYRVNKNKRENLRILALLYIIGVVLGILTDMIF